MVRTRHYRVAFGLGAVLLLGLSWLVIGAEHRRTMADWQAWLASTAENRAELVGLWVAERRADARVTAQRPTVHAALTVPRDRAQHDRLAAVFDSLATAYGYDAVLLTDRDGRALVTSGGAPPVSDTMRAFIRQALVHDSTAVAVLYEAADSAGLVVAAPVRLRGAPAGAVLQLISPERRLFPIVLRAAGRVPTEVVLAGVRGDDAHLISATWQLGAPTRPWPHLRLDTAGEARRRLFQRASPFERYTDFADVRVFASAARVPGTDWVLVMKVSRDEALAGFDRIERLVMVALALGWVALALGLRMLWRRAEAQERQASAVLAASERRFKDLMETVELVAVICDRDGRIVFCNQALAALTGHAREELVGRDAITLLRPEDQAQARAQLVAAMTSGVVPPTSDAKLVTREGRHHRVHWNSTVLRDADGHVEGFASIGEDVTALREVEERLRQSEERYRALVDGARDLIFALDDHGRLASLNPAFETMTGWPREEWLGRPFDDIVAEPDRDESRATFARLMRNDARRPMMQLRLRKRDGGVMMGEFTGTPQVKSGRVVGVLGVCRDVTERTTLEQQLRQSSRMEAVGQLAGGIAHDFNNLLTVIIGSTELLLGDMPEDSPWRADVAEIRASAGRAALLTRQLLAFSRRQMLAPRATDLNSLVTGAAGMLRRLIGEHIALEVKLHRELGAVRADPGQLEQVIVNLAVNARDAMPSGGTLTIATSELRNAEPVSLGAVPLPPGDWCVLEVRDTGHGMTADVLAHLFEPFFTTKPPGKGTGLGLASAYGVIKQSQGFIAADSEPGRGATFRIYLPRAPEPTPAAAPADARPVAPRGSETVLLVEDESTVRAVARLTLARHGYRVLEAGGGQEALSLTVSGAGRLDLLLTDVVMPGMSGPELAARLQQRQPGLRVLFMSGYAEHAADGEDALGGAPLLTKPFTPDDLARKVREVIDRGE